MAWLKEILTRIEVEFERVYVQVPIRNDDDVYLDKLQTKGVKKSILYM